MSLSMVLGGLISPGAADADPTQNVFGTWNSVMLSGNFGALSPDLSKFHWLVMDQVRTRDDSSRGTRFSENLIWAQLGYDLHPYANVWLGYTHDWIDPLKGPSFEESRPYEDLLIRYSSFEGTLQSRTRFEQRVNLANGSLGLRAREWIQYTHPLTFISDRLSLYAGDEVLFYLNNNSFGQSGFSENRAIGGLSVQFTPELGLDLGYLDQYVVNRTGPDLFTHNLSANIRYQF